MSSNAASERILSTKASLLSGRAVVAVSGEDARPFLQGLITNDINKVTENTAIFTALLSAQGKFLFDFFIIEHEGRLLLDVDKSSAVDLIKRLSMYKLRSKVEIAALPEMRVGVEWGEEELQVAGLSAEALAKADCKLQGIAYHDPRLPEFGIRAIGDNLSLNDNGEYKRYRLSLGVPEGGKDLIRERSFPMQWGYDKLHAIDFNKGCYVGQEVTARTKHIGTIRKMVHQVKADKDLPAPGTPIMAAEQEVGQMASSVGNTGLALLNIEAVNSGVQLYSGEVKIQARLPAWVATL